MSKSRNYNFNDFGNRADTTPVTRTRIYDARTDTLMDEINNVSLSTVLTTVKERVKNDEIPRTVRSDCGYVETFQ